ncbi:hypothetical protein MAPG_02030 [Magnaporthiopsis poae ATCC 64411]|uniref:Major facilitator superfamily (MFS) profile domain-containing protein n=1 Tax=Magnaporthiopsis poae (strain ATCC 64411 / 73-15) TaxID=644358 RepID=A0A0C4DQ92_MAGP6|nr:hypothetical protein MAPG_02030 [Magnaporthiopsis poae ATCC 64411]
MANNHDHEEEVPGTVRLVDVNGSGEGAHDRSNADIVLVPRPSADPNDPLNWSPRRKLTTVSMAYLYIIGTGIATSLQYSVLADITRDTGISTADLVQGTGLMFLFFGWACLIWQPIALTYGRRGVYLVTMLLTVAMMEWTARSATASEWMAHRILIGIIVSPIESLCEVTVFDMYFAHNRGTYMGLYVFILFGSNFLAPLVAGWFNDAYGWRWTMHLGSIVCAVCFVVMFLFMEETIYFRSDDGFIASDQSSVIDSSSNEKDAKAKTAEDVVPTAATGSSSPPNINAGLGKYTFFKALPGRPSNVDMLKMVYRPVLMIFKLPTVAWSGFLYGINLSWYMVLNGTVSPVLSAAPYNFSAALVGSVYAGPIIGAAAASLWSGNAADWLALRLAWRNGGVREPEHRLWVLLLAALGVVGRSHHLGRGSLPRRTLGRPRLRPGHAHLRRRHGRLHRRQLQRRLLQGDRGRDHGVRHADPQHHRLRHQLRHHALVDHPGPAELLHHRRHDLHRLHPHLLHHDRLRQAHPQVVHPCLQGLYGQHGRVAGVSGPGE